MNQKNILRLSVDIAKQVREEYWESLSDGERNSRIKPVIAASIGSYGAFLANGAEYTGIFNLNKIELMNFHRERMAILASSGPDLIAFETIPSLTEGQAIVDLLSEFPNVKAWISFSCKDEEHSCGGDMFQDCVKLANNASQVIAVGVNCTQPKYVSQLIQIATSVTTKPIIAYPNRGECWDSVNKCWTQHGESSERLVEMAYGWLQQGCAIIGGCCRTTPEDIKQMSNKFRSTIT